jgi:hypothetical protein
VDRLEGLDDALAEALRAVPVDDKGQLERSAATNPAPAGAAESSSAATAVLRELDAPLVTLRQTAT